MKTRTVLVGIFFALMVAYSAVSYSHFLSLQHMLAERGWNASPTEPGGPELVNRVLPDGPAATVLQVGDEIVAINSQIVERSDYKTENAFREVNSGDSYSLTVRRDGQVRDLGGCQMNCVNDCPSSVGTRPSKMMEKACIA